MMRTLVDPRHFRSTIFKVSTDLTNYKKEVVAILLATVILAVCVFLSELI